jgi:hypothetical protein
MPRDLEIVRVATLVLGALTLAGVAWELISARYRAPGTTRQRPIALLVGMVVLFGPLPAFFASAASEPREELRRFLLRETTHIDPYHTLLLRQSESLFIGSLCAVALCFVLVACARYWRQSAGASVALQGIFFATLLHLGITTYCDAVASFAVTERFVPHIDGLQASEASLGLARFGLVVAGVLAALLWPLAYARPTAPPDGATHARPAGRAGRLEWGLSLLVLALGVAAFAATRDLASDAQLAGPRWRGPRPYPADESLPVLYVCHEPRTVSPIEVHLTRESARLTFDGIDYEATAATTSTTGALQHALDRHHEQRRRERCPSSGHCDAASLYGYQVAFTIDADTPMQRVAEWLGAFASVYLNYIRLAGRTGFEYDTRTLGRIAFETRCSVNVQLEKGELNLHELASVQQLAHAASRSRRSVKLWP